MTFKSENLRINIDRLWKRLNELGKIGALEGGGVKRLALTEEDRKGRKLLMEWMKSLGLEIRVDQVGNMLGIRPGQTSAAPVMIGSHLDTVGTGGLYDGSLGVLAGLEVIEVLNENEIQTQKPLAIANFTNEEGVRFTPDMMGSLVFSGGMPVEEVLAIAPVNDPNSNIQNELQKIGFDGTEPCGKFKVDTFLELHIEQGPVLEAENIQIAAVEAVQGIYWTEYELNGTSNHAGTTPLRYRKDAGLVAAQLVDFARALCVQDPEILATAGRMEFFPNMPNVIAEKAMVTVDLRTLNKEKLINAQRKLDQYVAQQAKTEGVQSKQKNLVRFDPVPFDPKIIGLIEQTAQNLGYSVKTMPSGAGHDAQMLATICPTAMIFVPSKNGISHNVTEFTSEEDLERGANVLLHAALGLLGA